MPEAGAGEGGSKTYTQEEVDALLAEKVGDVGGLKANRDEILKERRALQKRLEAFGDLDPEKAREALTAVEEAERQKAERAGEFDKLRAKLVEQHGRELEGVRGQTAKARKALENEMVRARLQAALVKAGALAPTLDLVTDFGMRFGRLKETEDGYEAELHENGQPMYAEGGARPMDFDTFAATFVKSKYPGLFEGTGSSGGGATQSTVRGGGTAKTIASGDNAAFLANLEAIKEGKARVR